MFGGLDLLATTTHAMTPPTTETPGATDTSHGRRHWMSVLARAPRDTLEAAVASVEPPPNWTRLRGPEAGTVMVRGRIGGTGAAFNLGEVTVVRCSVRLVCGTVGHAYVAGRDLRRAELAAVCDALLQTAHAAELSTRLIAREAKRQAEERAEARRRAAATRVEFFTLTRMG